MRGRAAGSVTSVCARASISAVSVPGMIEHQVASASAGMSLRSGLIETNFVPRARDAVIAPRTMCLLVPPPLSTEFFAAMPPNASTMSVCSCDIRP